MLHEAGETREAVVPFEPKHYGNLYGMSGFSEGLLATHFQIYEGHVANTNSLLEEIAVLTKEDRNPVASDGEARRRFGWEFNGMRLHEYYFENLGGDGSLNEESSLHRRLCGQFGRLESWKEDFASVAALRGVGWAVLYEDVRTGRLFDVWVDEHNVNLLAGGRPLVLLDAFEHAYMKDYGLDRKRYIHAFFANLNWDAVLARSGGKESNGFSNGNGRVMEPGAGPGSGHGLRHSWSHNGLVNR
jgi:Fe-Mn family superoxide dismutase